MRNLLRVALPAVALTAAACSGPTVVNTEDAAPPAESVAAPVPTTTTPSNAHLANAFDYAAAVAGQTNYYFTSPSGRWECAIIPRISAGCQDSQSTGSIGIDGAPEEVPGPDGEPTTPTVLVIDRTGEPHFAALAPPGLALEPGPAVELPFNRILAVAGFRCNVQEVTGISCLSELTGKGFTFTAEGFTTAYTDVPADAP
ncbi:hypothetical protein FHR72_004164 [Mycolicibacterium iranicum]|uniref:Lipoprotein n=1 Tax=Mycolicibacterium iranicum TaxID=912594 RepID=A0A839Q9J6_MYCIR|nr:hypothetical protein [Mycolicibacterium iranicum]MBB2992660.1 hypothetical protein [Mycolicibacterium iranicum]